MVPPVKLWNVAHRWLLAWPVVWAVLLLLAPGGQAQNRGTPENPMTRHEVVAKSRDLMTPVLGAGTSANLIDKVLTIENVKDIRELRPLLQRT